MLYFFDTSALVKRYHTEEGSSTVNSIFDDRNNRILITNISMAEFVSALNRIKNRGGISGKDFSSALSRLAVDIISNSVGVIDITRKHIINSYEFIIKFSLTSNDAIILAAVVDMRVAEPVFVCADVRSGLLKAAHDCHISILNPLNR